LHIFNIVVAWLQLHSVIGMTAVFALLVLATYWPGRRAAIERNATIPLQDDR
jgi:cbb3-type cytochrome oxidase subunit 3